MTFYEETNGTKSQKSQGEHQATELELREAAEQFLQRDGAPDMTVDEVLEIPEIYEALSILVVERKRLEEQRRQTLEREAEAKRLREQREAEERKRLEEQAKRQTLLGLIAQEQKTLQQEIRRYTPADLSAPLEVEIQPEPQAPKDSADEQPNCLNHKLQQLAVQHEGMLPEVVFYDGSAACGYRGWLAMHHRKVVQMLHGFHEDHPHRTVYQERHTEFQEQFEAIGQVIRAHGLDPRTDRCSQEEWPELRRHFATDWHCAHLAEKPEASTEDTADSKRVPTKDPRQQELKDARDAYAERLMAFYSAQTDLHHHSAEAILRRVAKQAVRLETLNNLPQPTEALKLAAIERQLMAEEQGKVEDGEVHETARFLATLAGFNGNFLAVVSQHQHQENADA